MKTSKVLFVAAVLVASWAMAASAQPMKSAAGLGLNLTADQKAAIKAIRENTHKAVQDANSPADKLALMKAAKEQVNALLTPEQQVKLAAIRQARADVRQNRQGAVLAQLNLTKKQELQIAVIRARTQKAVESATTPADKAALIKSAWSEIKALLTPEQLAQLKQIRKNHHKNGSGIVEAASTAATLNLTDEQKATIKSIRQSTKAALQTAASPAEKQALIKSARQQIKALLTPDQLADWAKAHKGNLNNGQGLGLAGLNLTADQKAAIKSILESTKAAIQTATSPAEKRALRQSAREQIKALLTPAQLAQWKKTHPHK